MTCARPRCERRRDVGVHCRKCHQRWAVRRHNLHRTCTAGLLWTTWPAYAPFDQAAAIRATVAALKQADERQT